MQRHRQPTLQVLRNRLTSELSSILIQKEYKKEIQPNIIRMNKYRDSGNGLLATPIPYRLAAEQNKSATAIADELVNALRDHVCISEIERIERDNGYINFYIATDEITTQVLDYILDAKSNYGTVDGPTTRAIWDFASPNIGKPLHIGHLRNAVLGDILGNILETQTYDLIRINWLGDWGIQFSHLLHQFEETEEKEESEDNLLDFLSDLYQCSSRYRRELENKGRDNDLEQFHNTAQRYLSRLERGDENIRQLWERILIESENQFKTTYNRLGITFDIWTTESATVLKNQTDGILEILQDKDIGVEAANGAYLIPGSELEVDNDSGQDWPNSYTDFVLVKADGTTTYEIRDLALLAYRVHNFDVSAMFYVVGNDHRDHFRKLFTIARKIGYTNTLLTHINYGSVNLPNGSMSTREGRFITVNKALDRIYDQAITKTRRNNQKLDEEEIEEIAEKIAVGTLRFYMMSCRGTKNMTFDIEKVASLAGDTAPYVQYAAMRGVNILDKINEIPDPRAVSDQPFQEDDYRLAICLSRYPLVLERCEERYDTTPLAEYLLDLAQTFHRFYEENRVLDAKQARERRISLVAAAVQVFENAFKVAGIPMLQRM